MAIIKICGITNKKDALAASELGVEMLGFVFFEGSKRRITAELAEDIINELPSGIEKAGVFVDEDKDTVASIAEDAGLTVLQFHGNETSAYCSRFRPDYKVIKAFKLKDKSGLKDVNGYDADYYLFDTWSGDCAGGTGKTFDWDMLKDFEILKPVILSGGLNPGNVAQAIRSVCPFGVDVSTGVESSPGKKDTVLMKKFVENVRKL